MKNQILLFLYTTSFLSTALCIHSVRNELIYDINMSPYAGGEDLLFGHRFIERFLNFFELKATERHPRSVISRLYRLTELTLAYLPLNIFTSTVQHEVFGHGYRIRSFDQDKFSVSGYEFDAPHPYGGGGAATHFQFSPRRANSTELTTLAEAGIEAQLILAEQTRLKWLASTYVDPRQSILYLFSRFAISLYQSSDGLDTDQLNGNDLSEYTNFLNLTYIRGHLSSQQIKNLSLINLIDSLTYYAAFSWFRYLWTGKETKIPMIPIGGYGYLFSTHLGLSPFGPEYYLDQHLAKDGQVTHFYMKASRHAENIFFGGGFLSSRIWKVKGWTFGLRGDLWRQPKLLLHQGTVPLTEIDLRDPIDPENPLYSVREQGKMSFGGAGSMIISYEMNRAFGLKVEIGYKSIGYLPGYSLDASPVLRASYLATF